MNDAGAPPSGRVAAMRFMGKWEVAALIINKVFGTGIFTAPVVVLGYTHDKGEALLLWFLGLIFTWGRYVSHSTNSSQTLGVI